MATLSNNNINNTYFGLLKTAESTSIAGCGLTRVQDGVGCNTSLSVGAGNSGGACIHGNLTFGTMCGFTFPTAASSSNDLLIVNSSGITLGNVSTALSINTDQLCFNSNQLNLNPTCVTAIGQATNLFNTRGTVSITNETGDTRYYRNNNGKTCICLKELAASGFQKCGDEYRFRVSLYRRVGRGDFHLKNSIYCTTTSDNVANFALETNGDYRSQGNAYLGNSHIEIVDTNSGRFSQIANFGVASTRTFDF